MRYFKFSLNIIDLLFENGKLRNDGTINSHYNNIFFFAYFQSHIREEKPQIKSQLELK